MAKGKTCGRRMEGGCEVGSLALDGGVEVSEERVVDNSDDGPAGEGEAQGDGNVREAVQEVGRAIDGIDDECGTVGQAGGMGGLVALLADETVRTARGRL